MSEYSVKRRINEQGGSLRITLPRIWAEAEGLQAGDEVLIMFDSKPGLTVLPVKERPKK